MKKEDFANYEQSIAVKKLGFNEPCISAYNTHDKSVGYALNISSEYSAVNYNEGESPISRPLKSQIFRFFRDKYNFDSWIYTSTGNVYYYAILLAGRYVKESRNYNSHEEAENACVDRLIDVANNEIDKLTEWIKNYADDWVVTKAVEMAKNGEKL